MSSLTKRRDSQAVRVHGLRPHVEWGRFHDGCVIWIRDKASIEHDVPLLTKGLSMDDWVYGHPCVILTLSNDERKGQIVKVAPVTSKPQKPLNRYIPIYPASANNAQAFRWSGLRYIPFDKRVDEDIAGCDARGVGIDVQESDAIGANFDLRKSLKGKETHFNRMHRDLELVGEAVSSPHLTESAAATTSPEQQQTLSSADKLSQATFVCEKLLNELQQRTRFNSDRLQQSVRTLQTALRDKCGIPSTASSLVKHCAKLLKTARMDVVEQSQNEPAHEYKHGPRLGGFDCQDLTQIIEAFVSVLEFAQAKYALFESDACTHLSPLAPNFAQSRVRRALQICSLNARSLETMTAQQSIAKLNEIGEQLGVQTPHSVATHNHGNCATEHLQDAIKALLKVCPDPETMTQLQWCEQFLSIAPAATSPEQKRLAAQRLQHNTQAVSNALHPTPEAFQDAQMLNRRRKNMDQR